MVISVINEHWNVEDPDQLLTRATDEIASMEFNGFICNEIIPREDLLQAKNDKTGLVIDFGYYDRNSGENGVWVIYVINSDLDWENPIEKISNLSLSKALETLKGKLNEYATLNKSIKPTPGGAAH